MDANSIINENTKLNLDEIRAGKTNLKSKPIQFTINLTGRCNINPPCVFCSLKGDGYNYNAIDISTVDKYLPFLSRCETVTDCSFGEPFTHPDFLKLVQKVAENGQAFTFATNGLLLTQKRADILAAAGKNIGFSVSINAATSETYYKLTGQNFDGVITNLQYFINKYRDTWGHNPPLALSFVVMRMNCHEISQFLELANHVGIRNINLRHLFNMGYTPRPRDDFGYTFSYHDEMLTPQEYDSIGISSKKVAQELGLSLTIHWEPSESEIKNLSIPGVNIPCLFPWKLLYVQEHSKNVYMCGYSNAAVGHVNENDLEQIWNGCTMIEVRKSLVDGKIPEFCRIHGMACPLVLEDNKIKNAETLIEAKELSSAVVMGENDREQCAEGWHGLECFPPHIRWTSGKADVLLKVGKQYYYIMVQALTYYPSLKHKALHGHVELGNANIGDFTITDCEWHTLKFTLPKTLDDECIKMTIVIHEPWIPAKITSSSDQRELGIAVQRIWVE